MNNNYNNNINNEDMVNKFGIDNDNNKKNSSSMI